MKKISFPVVIPARNPAPGFTEYLRDLKNAGFSNILIAGGDSAETLPELCGAKLMKTDAGNGKGKILKEAFFKLPELYPDSDGVIVLTGCGLPSAGDVVACAETMQNSGNVVLAGRTKNGAGTRLTALMLRLACGIRIRDPQPCVWAIPAELLPVLLEVRGDGFEYETNLLLKMKRSGAVMQELQAEPNERLRAYDTQDSTFVAFLRAVAILIRFALSSLGSTLVDLLMFRIAYGLLNGPAGGLAELLSTVIARVISSFVNFNVNNKAVFQNSGSYKQAMLRYYALCIPQMLVSAGLVTLIDTLIGADNASLVTLIKAVVDTGLFFISYGIQREWVFSQKKK